MEIKDLIAKIAEYDEMEAPDGMNIVEATEEDIKDLANKDEQEAADGMNLLEKETNKDVDMKAKLSAYLTQNGFTEKMGGDNLILTKTSGNKTIDVLFWNHDIITVEYKENNTRIGARRLNISNDVKLQKALDVILINPNTKKSFMELLKENVEQEFEDADNRRKLRIYKKAYEALDELSDFLEEECVDPVLGDLDEETKAFNNKINELTQEIYSRSLAFEG